jgi:hypothetical protein
LLFEFLADLEKQGVASGRKIEIKVPGGGDSAGEIVEKVLAGDVLALPLPVPNYSSFTWLLFYDHSRTEKIKLTEEAGSHDEYKRKYPNSGSRDLRVLSYKEGGEEVLKFNANSGGFDQEMLGLWQQVCQDWDIPVIVEQAGTYVYENPKYKSLFFSSA